MELKNNPQLIFQNNIDVETFEGFHSGILLSKYRDL